MTVTALLNSRCILHRILWLLKSGNRITFGSDILSGKTRCDVEHSLTSARLLVLLRVQIAFDRECIDGVTRAKCIRHSIPSLKCHAFYGTRSCLFKMEVSGRLHAPDRFNLEEDALVSSE